MLAGKSVNDEKVRLNRMMNWYYYWFYAIYSIYKRLSRDRHFDVFAIGMFSFFVSCLFIGILSSVFLLSGMPKLLYTSAYIIISLGLAIFIINYIIFLPERRQLRLYEEYKNQHSKIKDWLAIIISILSMVIFFVTIIQGRKYYI